MTVLVVEDDPDIRQVVSEILDSAGYNVLQTSNGAEALTILEDEHPHVILLDMRMPVMDGWEFARQYHQFHDHHAHLQPKIVVMTAAQDAFQRRNEIQADGVLSKPFDMQQLLAAVSGAIDIL